jgi:hypothetical protein
MGGDTIVNDTTYFTLWLYQECWVQQTDPPSVPPWCDDWDYTVPTGLYAFLRQDTAARTVHVRFPWEGVDHLLYDFTMGLGAYPQTYNHEGGVEVVEIDSVELADGFHRRWTLSAENWDGPVHVIEGVGSDAGLFVLIPNSFEGHNRLECFGVDNVALYVRGVQEGPWECGLSASIEDGFMDEDAIRVWPNPTNGVIHAEVKHTEGAMGMIVDAIGRPVRSLTLLSGDNTIDLSQLPSGIYLIRIVDGHSTRVVVE